MDTHVQHIMRTDALTIFTQAHATYYTDRECRSRPPPETEALPKERMLIPPHECPYFE